MEESYGFKPEFVPLPMYPVPSNNSPSDNNQAYRWVDWSTAYGSVPPTAVEGGRDSDDYPIYVGRAFHAGDLIPAKIIPGKNAAYVAHNGDEHSIENFQVLCKQYFDWVPSHGGQIPPGAVPGGYTKEQETLYIGRAHHAGSQTVGKIHPSHGQCYIPFGGQELGFADYETLVLRW